ncbi:hypothetical protein [Thiolapillus sp.]|uniref:NADH-quinone oxidoreductase subunit D-related protein n=7 Tax=Thiolapillus sp. TaxID=2017437 RepID=UPI0025DBDFA6|nr:hypothetical protein [Thiolapillus sp.]
MRPENYEAKRQPPSNEFELNFGPNHPGIEGNYAFRVKVSGDTVLEGRADAGYLHRGFEKLMENRLWIQNIAITPRICVPDPVPMEVIYCLSVEDLCGLEVPAKAQWLRVLQMEMSRFAAYLFYFGGLGATNGMYTPHYWGMADRDLILDLFEELCGGRVYHIYNIPGGVRRDIPDGWLERVSSTFDYQACLRPRDRFWDIPVPKIDSAFDNLFVPQPSWSPSTTQQLRKLVAAPYLAPNDWTPRSEAYVVFPLAQGTPGKQCGLAATGVYQPSLRSPWLAATA